MRERRTKFKGLVPDTERSLEELFREHEDRLLRLERKGGRAGFVSQNTAAVVGEFLNIEAPAAGLSVVLPQATPALRNARVTLATRNANPVKVVSILGSVNGESFLTIDLAGTFECICNGLDGWELPGYIRPEGAVLPPPGEALDAEYVLGASHAELPNGRAVATSTEIAPDVSSPGVITWALRSASVVFSRLANLTGLSVLGRAANSAGVMAAITATAARQTLRANDAGTALEWGHPVEIRDSGADQGDAYAIDFVAGSNVNLAASVAGGVATITPSVDLSSVTYTAGDGLVLAANQFSVGAGTGITVNANDVAWSGLSVQNNNAALGTFVGIDCTNTTSIIATSASNVTEATIRFERAALTGAITASQNSNSTLFGTMGAGIGGSGTAALSYVGTDSEVQLTGISGNQGTIDISTLECGGRLEVSAPAGDWQIEGFAARAAGFWFFLTTGSTDFVGTILNEDATATATNRIRTPGFVDYASRRQSTGIFVYGGTRWFFIASEDRAADHDWTGNHSFSASTFFVDAASTATLSGQAVQLLANGTLSDLVGTATRDVQLEATRDVVLEADEAINITSNGDTTDRINILAASGRIDLTALETRLDSSGAGGGFLSLRGASASTPAVPADHGLFWVFNSGSETFPMFTDEADNDRFLGPVASDSEVEAGTSLVFSVCPGRQHLHPSAAKCWGFTTGGASPVLGSPSYNVTSITDLTSARITVNIGTDFSSSGWSGAVSATTSAGQQLMVGLVSKAAGTVNLEPYNDAGAAEDPGVGFNWVFFGEQ